MNIFQFFLLLSGGIFLPLLFSAGAMSCWRGLGLSGLLSTAVVILITAAYDLIFFWVVSSDDIRRWFRTQRLKIVFKLPRLTRVLRVYFKIFRFVADRLVAILPKRKPGKKTPRWVRIARYVIRKTIMGVPGAFFAGIAPSEVIITPLRWWLKAKIGRSKKWAVWCAFTFGTSARLAAIGGLLDVFLRLLGF